MHTARESSLNSAWIQSGAASLVVVVCLAAVAAAFVRRYAHTHDREPLSMLISIIGLSLTLAACTVIPADIFLVSATNNHRSGMRFDWATDAVIGNIVHILLLTYYSMYFVHLSSIHRSVNRYILTTSPIVIFGLLAFFSFVAIPFSYFFYEEYNEGISLRERVGRTLKYTLATILLGSILFLVGGLIKPASSSEKIDFEYFKHILLNSGSEKSLLFVLSVIMLFGMCIFVVYTTPGLIMLPVSMLKSVKSYERDLQDVSTQLTVVNERIRKITDKYHPHEKMTSRDQIELDKLECQQSVLLIRLEVVERSTRGYFQRCQTLFHPVKILFGILLLVVSLTIMCSILMVSIAHKPPCDNCPLLALPVHIPHNPLDGLLLTLSDYYPLNHILLSLLIVYFLFATIHGITRTGIRFLWVHMYKVRTYKTHPQGLLLVSLMCMGALLAIAWEMNAVVGSQYATWGTQTYCNHTVANHDVSMRDCSQHPESVIPCDLTAPLDACTPSALSTIITRMAIFTPIFPVIFYYTQFVILMVALLSLIYAVFSRRQGRADDVDDEDERYNDATNSNARRRFGDPEQGRIRTTPPRPSKGVSLVGVFGRKHKTGLSPLPTNHSAASSSSVSGAATFSDHDAVTRPLFATPQQDYDNEDDAAPISAGRFGRR